MSAFEIAYLLHVNLPALVPPPPCDERRLDVCVLVHPFPWPWIALTALLITGAVAIILRRRIAIPAAIVGQALFLLPFVRDTVYAVGSFLFTGHGYDAVDPDFQDLAFIILVLSVAIGPALTFLLQMTSRPAAPDRRPARVAAILLILCVVAGVVLHATLHDCEFYGGNPPMADGQPWCTPFAQVDFTPLLVVMTPSLAMLLVVCAGLWRARTWATAGGIVWQLLLATMLAAVGVALWNEQSQNAWYDHFPSWTSPRQLAYVLMFVFPVPTLAALLAARSPNVDRHPRGLAEAANLLAQARRL